MDERQRSSLFEEPDHAPRVQDFDLEFDSIVRELEAVAHKTKSMSVFSIPKEMIGNELYVELLKKSSDMGLMAAVHRQTSGMSGKGSDTVFLFFLSQKESWRIPAYLTMKRAFHDYDWSDGAEFQESTLLGYSENQAASWIRDKKRSRIGWLGLTCYFLVNPAQREAIKRLANCCIDPSFAAEDIEVFYNTDNLPPKKNAHQLLPEGMNLCRASIKYDFFRRLFSHHITSGRKVDFFVSAINSGNVSDLNESLQSKFEFVCC